VHGRAIRAAIAASLLVVVVSVSAQASAAPGRARSGRVDTKAILKFGVNLQEVDAPGGAKLDPAHMQGDPQYSEWGNLIYDNLARAAPSGGLAPGLATKWTLPDDHTITLTLRRDVMFQDGTPFDANAVKFGLERTLHSPDIRQQKDFAQLASVDVIDDHAVRLNLNSPIAAAFLSQLTKPSTFVVSPTAVQKEGDDFADHPVGAGPYKVTAFDVNRVLSLRKAKGYWDKGGWRLAGVDFVQIAAGPQSINGILSGQIDMFVLVDQATAAAVREAPDIKVFTQASDSSMYYLDLCENQPPFDKVEVRRAVAYAIDRNELNQAGTNGEGVVSDELFPKGSRFYFPEYADKYPHNLQKARQLLKRAGLANGASFDLATFPNPTFDSVVLAVQAQLEKVGLRATIKATANIVQDAFIDKKYPSNLLSTIDPGPAKLSTVTPGNLTDYCGYDRSEVSAAIQTIKSSAEPDQQKQAWRTAQQALAQDVPFLVLYFGPLQLAYNAAKVGGVTQLLAQGSGPTFRQIYMKQ
jgi:ABC-type transport system substrate-binding protein